MGAAKQRGGQGWADVWYKGKHKDLDRGVLDGYGWPHDLGDEEILERLLALNLERAGDGE